MAIIVKNDFGASNVLAQIGNYGNFIAYLVMGIPRRYADCQIWLQKTALIGLAIGIIGILIQWLSGHVGKESAFLVLSDRSVYQRFHHVYFELRSQPDA